MKAAYHKHSYTVTCSSAFRDAVDAMARARKVNVGDLARSVMLVVPPAAILELPDPGEPPPGDRETVILKSGPAEGRPWRRKPRLQVRMSQGFDIPFIRKALALALLMGQGEIAVRVDDKKSPPAAAPEPLPPPPPPGPDPAELARHVEEVERLRTIIGMLAFEPLPQGVQTREEALHVLGFPPASRPDDRTLRSKFRLLATIHHPDSSHGNHQRMSQLNAAMDILKRGAA
ncbi:MAG: J domain-containing protein [Rhodospirillales bacterium]|nr:MAG: J domain-containing protein [Rhodospirillales bacterium]